MPRKCSICTHPDRNKIDSALTARTDSIETISKRYSVTVSSLNRHMASNHLSRKIAKAVEAKEATEAGDLLGQVKDLSERALTILSKAEGTGDLRTACAAIREVRGTLELLLKVSGQLKPDGPTVNVGILIEPEKIIGTDAYREYERRVYAEIAG